MNLSPPLHSQILPVWDCNKRINTQRLPGIHKEEIGHPLYHKCCIFPVLRNNFPIKFLNLLRESLKLHWEKPQMSEQSGDQVVLQLLVLCWVTSTLDRWLSREDTKFLATSEMQEGIWNIPKLIILLSKMWCRPLWVSLFSRVAHRFKSKVDLFSFYFCL